MSVASTCVGTPLYLAPELCEGKEYQDKADIWSLGAILYELCALTPPFTARVMPALVMRICSEPPPPLPALYSAPLRERTLPLTRSRSRTRTLARGPGPNPNPKRNPNPNHNPNPNPNPSPSPSPSPGSIQAPLRELAVEALLCKDPAQRPRVHEVLELNFVKQRIERFLEASPTPHQPWALA